VYCRSSTSSRTSRTTLRLSLGLQAHLTQNFHPPVLKCLHEIKHDGFRIIARKSGAQVRLYSRPGNDLTRRFPLIVETLARLRSRSCIIDGEAEPFVDVSAATELLFYLERALLLSKGKCRACESVGRRRPFSIITNGAAPPSPSPC